MQISLRERVHCSEELLSRRREFFGDYGITGAYAYSLSSTISPEHGPFSSRLPLAYYLKLKAEGKSYVGVGVSGVSGRRKEGVTCRNTIMAG